MKIEEEKKQNKKRMSQSKSIKFKIQKALIQKAIVGLLISMHIHVICDFKGKNHGTLKKHENK